MCLTRMPPRRGEPMMGYTGDASPLGGASSVADRWVARIARSYAVDAHAIEDAYQCNSPTTGYSADLAMAQAVIESGDFTSPAFRSRSNMAGIGITGDAVAGPNFGTIVVGVRAH